MVLPGVPSSIENGACLRLTIVGDRRCGHIGCVACGGCCRPLSAGWRVEGCLIQRPSEDDDEALLERHDGPFERYHDVAEG